MDLRTWRLAWGPWKQKRLISASAYPRSVLGCVCLGSETCTQSHQPRPSLWASVWHRAQGPPAQASLRLGECWSNAKTWQSPEVQEVVPCAGRQTRTLNPSTHPSPCVIFQMRKVRQQKNLWARYKCLLISVVLSQGPAIVQWALPFSLITERHQATFP